MLHLIPQFMSLFEGNNDAYGTSIVDPRQAPDPETGKIKGRHYTITEPVNPELWRQHLIGQKGIGIIPINKDSKCKWGCIDVDIYAMDHAEITGRLHAMKLPLVLTRTKSGGAHLWLFLHEWMLCGEVRAKMTAIAALLGFGGSEIYPKQVSVSADRNDLGNWVNMPYQSATKTTRFCIDECGRGLNADAFIIRAQDYRQTPEGFYAINVNPVSELPGGPPCLQHLARHKLPAGSRNNGMFSFGVYAKKSAPDNWQNVLHNFNNLYCVPPLESHEMDGIVKSLERKDFFYKCDDVPCRTHCNKDVCRTCQFGIGQEGAGVPVKGSLTVYTSQPPIYFLDMEGFGRICISSKELINQNAFREACIIQLQRDPHIDAKDFKKQLDGLLKDATIIQAPIESSKEGVLENMLKDWLMNDLISDDIERLGFGVPVRLGMDYFFKLESLERELKRRRMDELERNELVCILTEKLKAKSEQVVLKDGKRVRTFRFRFQDPVERLETQKPVIIETAAEVLY